MTLWVTVRVTVCVCVTMWVALCGLRCVGDDVGDGMRVTVR